MIFSYVNGDLLGSFQHSDFDAIAHGCNCFHTMGAGIAGQISSSFPEAFEADKKQTESGDWGKLGTYSKASTCYGDILNAYTQYRPGKCPKEQLYKSIEEVFTQINSDYAGKIIGIPKIGCGIAGGDWDDVSEIIHRVTPDVKIVVFYV